MESEAVPVPAAFARAPAPLAGSDAVAWITESTQRGRTIIAAIPPLFSCYATIRIPDGSDAKSRADGALVEVLESYTSKEQPWWLGYLDTGLANVSFTDSPLVSVYYGWSYAMVAGDPAQALTLRRQEDKVTPWHSALPELMFPRDHSWLLSTMWDDDWRCLGGAAPLVEALVAAPELEVQAVDVGEEIGPTR